MRKMNIRRSADTLDPEKLFIEADGYDGRGDFKCAFQCFLKAARLGHTGCQVNLGNYYAVGKGTTKNMATAAYWYKKAYKNGDRTGALNLGIDRRDEGRKRSAAIWLKKGVAMNDGDACIALAKLYKDQQGKREAAIALLKQVLQMGRADISEEGKQEAVSLLKEIGVKR
jgi:TPR repeat protein